MQNSNESLIDVLALLYRRRKMLVTVCLIAGIVSAGVSLLLPDYYEASTQFYAASPDQAQPSPLGNQPDDKRIYGNDYDIDRLISISQSSKVKNFLIDSFDLYTHYEIDPKAAKAKYKMLLKLDKYLKVNKTKYDAIKLLIEDRVPEKAADMANAVRERMDLLAQKMIKESQEKLIAGYRKKVERKQQQYDAIVDSLYKAREAYNIFNVQSQGEACGTNLVELEGKVQNYSARLSMLKRQDAIPADSIALTEAKLSGYRKQFDALKRNIKDYNDGYAHILTYERELSDFGDQLNYDKERLKQLEGAYDAEISTIHIIEEAEVPVAKSRPKRSFIVIGAVMLSFILMSMWFIVQEQVQQYDWGKKLNNA